MATIAGKVTGGSGTAFNSVAAEVEGAGGVEEEFLFEGTATQFCVRGARACATDGRWTAEPMSDKPFRSRMLVVRPGDPAAFNGTVIVTWNNVSAGQDNFSVGQSAAQLIADGFALVGVTAQRVGVEGNADMELPEDFHGMSFPRVPGLRDHDPDRYGTLEHPGDGFSYDIFRQAGALLGPDRDGDIDPLGGLDVRHLIATGGSQSANRLSTYLNAIQPLGSPYDAFLLTVYAGCPTALDPATAPESLPQIPVNTVQLLEWRTYRLRDDLNVPVIVLNSEFEVEQYHPNNQPDTELLRFWEVAGTAHGGLMSPEMLDMFGPALGNVCTVSFSPASRAAIHALHRWVNGGSPPPHQPRLQKDGDPPALPRDDHGNARGGIRWPDVEAPLGTHVGESAPDGFANLMGSSTPFPPEKVRALYADREAWLALYRTATERLVDAEVVLADDADRMLARASATEFPA
jgi:hypothetical protein